MKYMVRNKQSQRQALQFLTSNPINKPKLKSEALFSVNKSRALTKLKGKLV